MLPNVSSAHIAVVVPRYERQSKLSKPRSVPEQEKA